MWNLRRVICIQKGKSCTTAIHRRYLQVTCAPGGKQEKSSPCPRFSITAAAEKLILSSVQSSSHRERMLFFTFSVCYLKKNNLQGVPLLATWGGCCGLTRAPRWWRALAGVRQRGFSHWNPNCPGGNFTGGGYAWVEGVIGFLYVFVPLSSFLSTLQFTDFKLLQVSPHSDFLTLKPKPRSSNPCLETHLPQPLLHLFLPHSSLAHR